MAKAAAKPPTPSMLDRLLAGDGGATRTFARGDVDAMETAADRALESMRARHGDEAAGSIVFDRGRATAALRAGDYRLLRDLRETFVQECVRAGIAQRRLDVRRPPASPEGGVAREVALLEEAPHVTAFSFRDLRQSVRRDLENLLNTRWRCSAWPPSLDELERSLVNYGIPDVCASSLGSAASREQFRRTLQRVIERFEPRLTRVRVELVEDREQISRTMCFRIEATIDVDPSPERVVFDSNLEPLSGTFEVMGVGT